MRRTPQIIVFASLLIALAIIVLQRAGTFDPGTDFAPAFLKKAFLGIKPYAGLGIVLLAVASAVVQGLEKVWNIYSFRKEVHLRFVDQVLDDLFEGDGLQHRITLFKGVSWFRALSTFLYRWVRFGEDRRSLLGMVPINPFAKYLVVYARCAHGVNPRSCSMFKVYDQSPSKCEGFAGLVWSREFAVAQDLPDVKHHLKRVVTAGDVRRQFKTSSKLRKYAVQTNLTEGAKLRAINRHAQHFLGTALWTTRGRKWGVLLVDSAGKTYPFPITNPEFEKRFKSYAKSLSYVLE